MSTGQKRGEPCRVQVHRVPVFPCAWHRAADCDIQNKLSQTRPQKRTALFFKQLNRVKMCPT